MDLEMALLLIVALVALGFDILDIWIRVQGFRRKFPQKIRWEF